LLYDFIKNSFNLLTTNLLKVIIDEIDALLNYRLILFIIYIIFLILGYLTVWVPFEKRLEEDVRYLYVLYFCYNILYITSSKYNINLYRF